MMWVIPARGENVANVVLKQTELENYIKQKMFFGFKVFKNFTVLGYYVLR